MECFFLRAALQKKLEYLLHDKQGLTFTYSHTMKDKEFYLSAEIKYNCLDVIKMWHRFRAKSLLSD
jgi:hypothetical protein